MFSDFIEQKPGVLGGKPVIKGTRIGVDLVLEKIGAGETMEDVLNAYPFLKSQSILACSRGCFIKTISSFSALILFLIAKT